MSQPPKIFQMPTRPHLLIFGVLVIIMVVALVMMYVSNDNSKPLKTIKVDGQKILVELAETLEARTKGLSDREPLPKNQGLLFIFPNRDYHAFWNYHLKFPIDVLWIDNGIIVDKTTLPIDNGQPITYTPKATATQVLEVNTGMAEKYGWGIGTKVNLTQ